MRQYHPLTIQSIEPAASDALRIRLEVPDDLADAFRCQPGQHIPVQAEIDGDAARRTYSICSRPGDRPLEIGIRVQPGGRFSEFARDSLSAGDTLLVMPPSGRFLTDIDPSRSRHVLAVAAGSGITPILSILTAVLEGEPDSTAILFYGNRSHQTSMFIDDLFALKNRFPERLQLAFLFSRESQEFEIMSGRLDGERTRELYRAFCSQRPADEAFVCGPDTMIDAVSQALVDSGLPAERIHSERFGVPVKRSASRNEQAADDDQGDVEVTLIMDGHRRHFSMHRNDKSLVDAAAEAGIDLPFSCKGGVCATCRTHLKTGEVDMAVNYGLEPWEVEQGFILACQSRPTSDELELDYDRS